MSQYYPPPPPPPRYANGSTAPSNPPDASTPYYAPPPASQPPPMAGNYGYGNSQPYNYSTPPPPAPLATTQHAGQPAHQYYYPPPPHPQGQQQHSPTYYPPPQPSQAYAYPSTPHYTSAPPSAPYAPSQNTQYPSQYAAINTYSPHYPAEAPPSYPPPPGNLSSVPQQTSYTHQPPPVPPASTRPSSDPPSNPPIDGQGTSASYFAPPPPSQTPRTPSYQTHSAAPPTQQSPASPAQATQVPPIQRRPVSQAAPQQASGHQHGTSAAAPQHPLSGLATQMNGLTVGPGAPGPISQAHRGTVDDSPRPPPPMRATGLPNEVLSMCPEWRAIDYSLYWYQMPDVPNFTICTRCHQDHIQNTPLASCFQRIKRADHEISSCFFWIPRVKEIIWPQALRSGSVDALRAFGKRRLSIEACKGPGGAPASEGIKWFSMVKSEIQGFISCEACYEDRVVGGPFEHRFMAFQKQKQDEQWACDVCIPYMARSIVEMAKRNNWSEFVASATRRFQLPACEGKEVQSNSCGWYLPRRKIKNLTVCEACYMDKVMLTRFENQFQRYSSSNDLDSFISQFTSLWTCKLTKTNLPMAFAFENALERRDWSVFQNASTTICRLVPCTANGSIGGNWWTLAGGCADYDVCEACYTGLLQAGGMAQFFEPARRNPQNTLVCDFCIASPRFSKYIDKFAQAMDEGVFSCYRDYVKTFASVPVCPGIKTREKTKWWGYPQALFCEDCYLSFVSKSAVGKLVPIKGQYDERAQICQIWSSRMRTMWLQVCQAGAPGSTESNKALAEFKAFGEKRLQIYNNTIPQRDLIIAMKKMKMQNAMVQGMASVMYNGMDGLLQASGATDGHLHGNSSVGWYATDQGAQGAQMFNNMQAGFMNANRVDEWMQAAQLEGIWKQVE